LEIIDGEVLGVPRKLFKNAPNSLREVLQMSKGHGDKTFLVYENERYSFAQTMELVDACSHALVHRYGVRKGDRVAIAMRNYPEWVIAFGAALSIGAISVSLNSLWTEDELDYAIGDSSPTVLIGDAERIDRCRAAADRIGCRIVAVRAPGIDGDAWTDVVVPGNPLPDVVVDPDDDATILYTSGTTGRPKGAVSTHRAIISAIMAFGSRSAVDAARKGAAEVDAPAAAFILIVPLFHVTGCVAVMMSSFIGGAKLVMMYKWNADKALELIARERITNFVGVPTQAWDLVHSPRFADYDTSSLRLVGGGGAPAPPALVAKVAGAVRNGGPNLGYGMTETNAYGPGNSGADYIARPTSTGRVIPLVTIEIRDADDQPMPIGERGEIWFYGANLIRGYWNKPEATAETIVNGWLRSGDIGRLDDEGFLYIEDRAKDMILRGGENVYGAEVEAAIYEHPAVHEAAVYGVPDERLGEEVGVTVKLHEGHALTADELSAFLAKKIAPFKIPRHMRFTTDLLPRNAAGKFLKRELRDQAIGDAR
jgi:long-chain acyl-CoA synthetase